MEQPTSPASRETRILIYEDARLSRLPDPLYRELEILMRELLSSTVALLLSEVDDPAFASAGGYYIGRIYRLYIKNHPE